MPASGFRSGCARWTSSVVQARGPARSRAQFPCPRSRQRLPQHDCNQARECERYQIGCHDFSTKRNARQIARRSAVVSGANPISVPGDRSGASKCPAPRPARSRVHGQQWFGRRRADRRSRFDECVAVMRRRRPILKSRRKNPRRMCSARVNQTRLDDVIMPVFCPTCQSLCRMKKPAANFFARAKPNVFR